MVVKNFEPLKSELKYHRTNKLFAVKCNGNDERNKENRVIMTRAIEVVYENNVFKPLGPVEGIEEHERMVAIFSRRPVKKGFKI
jgi:hypothetical protein